MLNNLYCRCSVRAKRFVLCLSYLQPLECSLVQCRVPWAVCHLPWPRGTPELHQPTEPGLPVLVSVSSGHCSSSPCFDLIHWALAFLIFFLQEAAWPLEEQASLPAQHQTQVAFLQATLQPGRPLLALPDLQALPARIYHLQVRHYRNIFFIGFND